MDENKITLELEPTPAPTLTFDPLGEAAAEAAPAEKKDEMAGQQALDESTLTEEERKMVNDFEEPIFKMHPILNDIKTTMYSAGAAYASMSGSGSAIYGLFAGKPDVGKFRFENCFFWEGKF